MRRLVLALALVVLAVVPLARAVTNGEPDNGAHPYVGLVAFYDADDVYAQQRCSGTLLTPTVFLTAAHCAFADDGTAFTIARVWFEDVVPPGAISAKLGGLVGTVITHPDFDGLTTLPDTNDIAVVELDAPVPSAPVGVLPAVGLLDTLKKKDTSFTLVGYGLATVDDPGDRTRRTANARLGGLNGKKTAGFNVKTKPGKGGGTFCFGDSGGPVLLADTNVVVALNSFVNQKCKGAALSFRVDTTGAQTFLAPFVVGGDPGGE
jgi:secreted trypsin-like serine protease